MATSVDVRRNARGEDHAVVVIDGHREDAHEWHSELGGPWCMHFEPPTAKDDEARLRPFAEALASHLGGTARLVECDLYRRGGRPKRWSIETSPDLSAPRGEDILVCDPQGSMLD